MSLVLAATSPTQPAALDVGPLVIAILLLFLAVLAIWAFVAAAAWRKSRWAAIRRAQGLPPATGLLSDRLAAVLRGRGSDPAPSLRPGPAVAAKGGSWLIADPAQLVAVPNTRHHIHVAYTPDHASDGTFAPAMVRAVLRARETWCDQGAVPSSVPVNRFPHTRTIMEVPAASIMPADVGRTAAWDFDFAIPGTAPATCGRVETLACDWLLAVSVDRSHSPDAILEQPIIMAQPRDRLMAGAIGQSLWSRFEETANVRGDVGVDFRVEPVPLDLAAPATAELLVTNDGPLIPGRTVRLEVRVQVAGKHAASDSWAIWRASQPISGLPGGQTRLRFEIPAINRPCPDADLPHGELRGKLRLVLDREYLPDIVVERDLCLCLDQPENNGRAR
jgi:hypothetical protein